MLPRLAASNKTWAAVHHWTYFSYDLQPLLCWIGLIAIDNKTGGASAMISNETNTVRSDDHKLHPDAPLLNLNRLGHCDNLGIAANQECIKDCPRRAKRRPLIGSTYDKIIEAIEISS